MKVRKERFARVPAVEGASVEAASDSSGSINEEDFRSWLLHTAAEVIDAAAEMEDGATRTFTVDSEMSPFAQAEILSKLHWSFVCNGIHDGNYEEVLNFMQSCSRDVLSLVLLLSQTIGYLKSADASFEKAVSWGSRGGSEPKSPHKTLALQLYDSIRPTAKSDTDCRNAVVAAIREKHQNPPSTQAVYLWVKGRDRERAT